MFSGQKMVIAVGLLAPLTGCYNDRPHDYGKERPPVDQLDTRDKGLQSKDLLQATDQMSMDLLALPELNESKSQWTIVATNVENETGDHTSYNIFIDRLKTSLARQGHGRVRLIENKARFHDLQNQELERGAPAADSAGVQPDFALYGKMQEMANRATSTYRAEFNLTNLKTREQVWSNEYLVKVAR